MELLTRMDAAKKLRIGVRTLDRRLASGELKCYRLGEGPRAPVRISEEQIDSYLRKKHSGTEINVHEQACFVLGR